MTFNYFNPSNLAFGSKLTTAFYQLNRLAESAEENLEEFFAQQEFFKQFEDRNYEISKPYESYNPVRSNEFFDILNDRPSFIRRITYDKDNKKISVKVNLFNRDTNRITRLEGETDILEGYCYYKPAISNSMPERELSFSEDKVFNLGVQLFEYKVEENDTISIIGELDQLRLTPFDTTQYESISKGEQVADYNQKYKAENYECVCIVGNKNNIQVKLNGRVVLQGYGADNVRHCILYLKPEDEITGSYARIFKVKYDVTGGK